MKFLTDFADQAVILPLVIAVGFALFIGGWRRGAFAWAIVLSSTLGAVLIAKVFVHACIGADAFPDLHSPSGHTASAAAVCGGLVALLLPAPVRGSRRLIAALLFGAAFAVAVGSTRLALHMHTVSDVVAGASLGLAGALALARFAGPRPPELRIATPVAAALAMMLLFHGWHLHAEEAIDTMSCRVWSGPLALLAPAPSLQPPSARP